MSDHAIPRINNYEAPALSVEVSDKDFHTLKKQYDLYIRADVSNKAFLDATAFGWEERKELATIFGDEIAEECLGQYVLIFHA